ncbi:MAG: hypothetical protein JWM57_120 [Phycisphaerales bacterium]|nr:hypothetical protein [Phycisphaerales bacterium]
MIRLLLDMGLSPATAAALRHEGYDAVHVIERGDNTMSDEQILRIAQSEQRVVVTFDLDFPRLLAIQRLIQASVVLFRVESINTARMTAWLLAVLPRYQNELIAGAILVLDGSHERLRTLPVWP